MEADFDGRTEIFEITMERNNIYTIFSKKGLFQF